MNRVKSLIRKIVFFILPRIISRSYLQYRVYYHKYDSLITELKKSALSIYEETETFLIAEALRDIPNPIVLDVGANIGLMSLNVCHFVPNSKVYAFEPGPFQYSLLETNIKKNDLAQRILPNNLAISDQPGTLDFYVHDARHSSGDGFLDTGRAGESKVVQVKASTLDSWWSRLGNPTVHLIKVDTEGAELKVLHGAKELLMTCKPVLLVEICYLNYEKYGHTFEEHIEVLDSIGYDLWDLQKKQRITQENFLMFKEQFYYLAIPR